MAFPRRMPSYFPLLIFALLTFISLIGAQNDEQCPANQIRNGNSCQCAPGYFGKKDQCANECAEEYSSYFVYGDCVKFPLEKSDKLTCNMKCGMRLYLWTNIALFLLIAATLVTLAVLLPMCVINCLSCLHAKKASKHSKQVALESQQYPPKDQQMQTLSYNPYSYWPYYGR